MSLGKSVLVIDDEVALVGSIKEFLEGVGFDVAVAFDGLQGVLQAHTAPPDAILLDFNMPAGGGASVYERLRNAPDTCRIPIVFTTAAGLEEVKGRIRPSPQTYFLKKPVSLAQIARVLGQVLGIKVELPDGAAGARPAASEAPPFVPAPASPASPEAPSAPPPSPFYMPPAAAPGPASVSAPPSPGASASPPAKAPPPGGRFHEFAVRVTYGDTDKLGIIYYANYFKYFESGRTELLRSLGVRYRDLELQRKLFLPAVEARCEYIGPSRYDDLLIIRTWLAALGPASIAFRHEIYDRDSADRLVARGFSRHAVVNDRWRPSRVPRDLRDALLPYVRP